MLLIAGDLDSGLGECDNRVVVVDPRKVNETSRHGTIDSDGRWLEKCHPTLMSSATFPLWRQSLDV